METQKTNRKYLSFDKFGKLESMPISEDRIERFKQIARISTVKEHNVCGNGCINA